MPRLRGAAASRVPLASALRTGPAEALGTSKQSAWEGPSRWIDQQAGLYGRIGYVGMDEQQAAAARALAGHAGDGFPG